MAEGIPPQLQGKLAKFQSMQQQIQVISSQKFQLEAQLRDTERAISELEKSPADAPIYKSVGGLMIRAESKEAIEKELAERKETMGIRIKALDRQEKQIMEQYQELQKELTAALSPQDQGDDST